MRVTASVMDRAMRACAAAGERDNAQRAMVQALTVVLILAVAGGGLCLLDDHAAALDPCLVLVAVATTAMVAGPFLIVLAGVPAPRVGWPRSLPGRARPAPI